MGASMGELLADQVIATLANHGEARAQLERTCRHVMAEAAGWPAEERFLHELDQRIGDSIARDVNLFAREDLMNRFAALLWATFMGAVAWDVVGKYVRTVLQEEDPQVPEGWELET